MKKKVVLSLALISQLVYGLEFGGMGNTSAGLGGSGVALKKSAWGVYYNPALLAADNRGKFGYSVGIGVAQKGVGEILGMIPGEGELDPGMLYDKFRSFDHHSVSLSSQNGIVIQITGGTYEVPKLDENGEPTEEMIEKRNPYGAFTMAAFFSGFAYGTMNAELKNAQVPQVEVPEAIHLNAELSNVMLLEVPVAWAWRFETGAGDVSIGTALKYMGAIGMGLRLNGVYNEIGSDFMLETRVPDPIKISHNFGIDLGVLYSISGASIGLVAKNINLPTFKLGDESFKIMPQVRLGLAYDFAEYFALTFDVDLTSNSLLFEGSPKNQMIGGGFLMDFKYIDLRVGVMGDMANKFEQGVILTGGINLLGFLDVALQASTNVFKFDKYKVPSFANLKIGGSFTF